MKYFLISICLFFLAFIPDEGSAQVNNTGAAELLNALDGGYYATNCYLSVKYEEEYHDLDGYFDVTVYDWERNTHPCPYITPITSTLGDHIVQFDITALPSFQFYVMEFKNEKNEIKYLRFYVGDNQNCVLND